HMIEKGWVRDTFVADHTTGFEALRESIEHEPWEELERQSGLRRKAMFDFAEMYSRARTAVFVWSMSITHHRFGVDNVKAIVNLGLAGGIVGRAKCGLMPIRGHSGVQGGSEMGANPKDFGLGFPVNDGHADLHGTARVLFTRSPGPPNRRGTSRVGDLHAVGRTGPARGRPSHSLRGRCRDPGRNREGGADLRRDPGSAGERGRIPVRGLP